MTIKPARPDLEYMQEHIEEWACGDFVDDVKWLLAMLERAEKIADMVRTGEYIYPDAKRWLKEYRGESDDN